MPGRTANTCSVMFTKLFFSRFASPSMKASIAPAMLAHAGLRKLFSMPRSTVLAARASAPASASRPRRKSRSSRTLFTRAAIFRLVLRPAGAMQNTLQTLSMPGGTVSRAPLTASRNAASAAISSTASSRALIESASFSGCARLARSLVRPTRVRTPRARIPNRLCGLAAFSCRPPTCATSAFRKTSRAFSVPPDSCMFRSAPSRPTCRLDGTTGASLSMQNRKTAAAAPNARYLDLARSPLRSSLLAAKSTTALYPTVSLKHLRPSSTCGNISAARFTPVAPSASALELCSTRRTSGAYVCRSPTVA